MKNYLFVFLLSICLFSCEKAVTPIDFVILLESTDVNSTQSALDLFTTYDIGENKVIPSFNSKIGYFNDQDFITIPVFSKSDWEDGLNVSMDQNRLSEQIKSLNIKDLLADSKNISPLIIENIHTYASSLGYSKAFRYLIIDKKTANSSTSEVTLSKIDEQIDYDLDDSSYDNFDEIVIVVGITKSAASNKYASTSKYEPTSEKLDLPAVNTTISNTEPVNDNDVIGLAAVNTKKTSLHFRSSPGVRDHNIISLAPKGTNVKVLKIGEKDIVEGESNYWVLVEYESTTGYMWGGYLDIDLFN